eukprot:13925525-Ditylum_brightwellii.AAC.2
MAHVKLEPEVTFGQALPKHLIWIWDFIISYPAEDILLWDSNATGAFRQCKLHPDISQLFSFFIELLLFVPCGNTFGSNTSPPNWKLIRRSREAIAKWLFTDEFLIEKHKDYTNAVQFEPLPVEDTVFTQAVADSQHKGVMDSNKSPVPTPHNMYVDDSLIIDIGPRMTQAMSASIVVFFILIEYPEPHRRRNAVCMEKFLAAQCAYKRNNWESGLIQEL